MPSIKIVGQFIECEKSRSLAGLSVLNISFKLPAIVASVMGVDNSPFLIQKPLAPRL